MTVLYVGCYTSESDGRGAGISAVRADPDTGELTQLGLVARCPSPSFLVRHPQLPVVYAANEVADGQVSAWAVNSDRGAELTSLGSQTTGGADPCHLAVHAGHLVTANYSGGNVAVHPLGVDGSLGEPTLRMHEGSGPHERQASPHPHMVLVDGKQLLVVDLGTDRVYRGALDEQGRLVDADDPVILPAGTGPRSLAISAAGDWHLVGELSATVLVGPPPPANAVPVSAGAGSLPAEVALSGDGSRLYVSNRGPDTISVFALEEPKPRMIAEVPSGGAWPRHFAIHGDLLYVANQDSDTLVSFRLDGGGIPVPTGHVLRTGSPTCVLPVG